MDKLYFNIPVSISEWHVEYKPLPLFKNKKVRHYLAYDYINDNTSFSDENYIEFVDKKYDFTLNSDMKINSGEEILRHHYLYKKKSWIYPNINKVNDFTVYLPYVFDFSTFILYEEITGKSMKINKTDKLYSLIEKGMG